MGRTGRSRLAAVGLAIMMALPVVSIPSFSATPPAESEPASPSVLTFPAGGGSDSTSISLERNTHVRDARLVVQGGTVETPTPYHLNATTWAGAGATAWSGSLPYGAPDQPLATYEATPFNATRVANVSAKDGALEKSPTATNFTYELYAVRVLALDLVELRVLWSGYSLPPAMPINWNGKMFLYNTTDLAWDEVGAYPFPLTGIQYVEFNATSPANYVEPGTGRVSIMIVSESTVTEVFTDFVEVTAVSGVYPRPAVDVGAEGGVDWRWDAPGWGAIGRQTEFEDGQEERAMTFGSGGGSWNESLLLPSGAQVSSASLIARAQGSPGSLNTTGFGKVVEPMGLATLNVTGLPTNGHQTIAFVNLTDARQRNVPGTSNNVTQTGTWTAGSDFADSYRYMGEVFTNQIAGKLVGVEINVTSKVGSPGPLFLELRNDTATGQPGLTLLAYSSVPESAVVPGAPVTFNFSDVSLLAGMNYTLVVRAPAAPIAGGSDYYQMAGTSAETFPNGQGWSYINITSLGETWSRVNNSDLVFFTRLITILNSSAATQIFLDSLGGTLTTNGTSSRMGFVVSGFSAAIGFHEFSLRNDNDVQILANWSASIYYTRLADDLDFRIGENNWSLATLQNLTTGSALDLSSGLVSLVTNSPALVVDSSGITFVRASVNVSSSSPGALFLDSLDIRYTLSLTTPDLSSAFDTYLWTTPPNLTRADIPLRIYSPGASTLTILESAITYDRPPVYFDFPSTVTDEDVPLVTDLNTVFHDDWDNAALSFYVNQTSGFENASIHVSGYNLTINPLENRSGNLVLTVEASDSRGLGTSSGPVLFSIRPFNDAPRLTIDHLNVSWGGIEAVDLTPFIVDAEFPALAITITSATGATVSVSERSLIFDFAVGAPDAPMLITLSDGSLSATYPLFVHPRQANTPPVLLPIPTVVIPNNAAWWMDLAPFAHDGEDSLSALSFSLAVPLADQNSLFWTIERTSASTFLKLIPRAGLMTNITTQLTVTDTDGNANTTSLGVRITAPPDTPPRIVGIDPIIELGADPATIFLATKYSDLEDANDPARVSWVVSNNNPALFTAEVDPSTQRLLLTPMPGASGQGSFTLTLRDSAGLETSKSFTVTVPTAYSGSSASVLAVGLFFAGVVVFAAVAARRARGNGRPPKDTPLDAMKREGGGDVPLQVEEGASEGDRMEMPAPEKTEDVGSFLRGLTETPTDTAPQGDEGVVTLGLKSGLDGASAPLEAPLVSGPLGAKPHARLAELYLFSLKDGGMLFEVPAQGLPLLGQADESEFLQWAFDTVRKEEKVAEAVKVLEWKGAPVVLARGAAFFIAGRARGEDFEPLKAKVRTLLAEVDSNFPGSTADWQRNDVVETVGDILKRLVR